MIESEATLLNRMHEREKYGLLPPQIDGYDPDRARIEKAYKKAFFESGFGFGLIILVIGGLVSSIYYFDLGKLLSGEEGKEVNADGEEE